jgi:hypothetical protein
MMQPIHSPTVPATTPASLDALFQLPLGEFTAARNALAARLKKSGHADESSRIKGLSKPSVSAWTVNQLFWRHRKAYDRLMQSGAQFREAQAAQLAGKSADIRRALEARREALSELSRLASDVLKDASHQPSPDTMRRVTTTLEALSTLANVPGAPRGGQLTDDVDPPGFESLAALVPSVGEGKSRDGAGAILPFQRKTPQGKGKHVDEKDKERVRKELEAEARAARQKAERTLREAQHTAEQAEAALKKAAARLKDAERAKAALDEQLEKASNELSEARQAARRITSEAEDAAQAVTDAERAIERLKD